MHETEHRVIYADTDAGGVVYYANYLKWFESGRRELFRNLEIDYNSLQSKGILVPVVEVHCNYLAPARYDDLLLLETSIAEIKEKSIKFEYKLFKKDGVKLLVTGHTVNVFVDSKEMKSTKIPESVKNKLKTG
ncbi:MAG TPA: thioesterase family protein [Candidatus Nanoarchaeia archaeon]|nr:thioesterase family protein [Candidatus Nanoarchaeia archaeon]